jgi:two-component system OmpR family response regulator
MIRNRQTIYANHLEAVTRQQVEAEARRLREEAEAKTAAAAKSLDSDALTVAAEASDRAEEAAAVAAAPAADLTRVRGVMGSTTSLRTTWVFDPDASNLRTLVRAVAEGLARGRAGDFDSVVLDRLLPDGNGIDLLRSWRRNGPVPPVLMLSALGSVKDRIEGLEAGADDYLAKPFHMAELVARVNAIVRRVPARSAAEIAVRSIGRLRLDPSRHAACFGEASVDLNRKLYSLLAHLMLHADRLVTRDMLLEQVWGYSFSPGTNIVESNMSRLRSRLQDLSIDPILTRRGEGYTLMSGACR